MALASRPRIGLKNVVFSVYDEGLGTYGTITSLANAMELSFDPGSSITSLFSDDGLTHSAESTGEMSISFGLADILPEHVATLLGHTYANGIIAQNTSDQSPIVALGFQMTRAGKDGSSNVSELCWMPRCKLSKPSQQAMTKGASVEFQTPMMEGRVMQNDDGDYMVRLRTDDPAASATTIANWFTTVIENTGASTTAVTVGTITGDNAANTITIPFAKSGETFSLKTVSAGDITVSVVSTGALLAGTSTYAYSAAGTAPTITITNANIDAVQYLVTVNPGVQDNNNVAVTQYSQLVTPA